MKVSSRCKFKTAWVSEVLAFSGDSFLTWIPFLLSMKQTFFLLEKDLGFVIILVLMDFLSGELTTNKSKTKGAPSLADDLPPRGMWGFKVFSLAFSFFVLVT